MDAEVKAEDAVNEGVDRLVREIDRAVSLIERLRHEKAELEREKGELQEKMERQAQELAHARAERDRLQTIYDENAALIDNKEEIERKIETMIARLDSVNTA